MKGQEYIKAGIEIDRTELDATYRLNRNAKGMLSFPPDASMIAEDTNGPMNALVLPTWARGQLTFVDFLLKIDPPEKGFSSSTKGVCPQRKTYSLGKGTTHHREQCEEQEPISGASNQCAALSVFGPQRREVRR